MIYTLTILETTPIPSYLILSYPIVLSFPSLFFSFQATLLETEQNKTLIQSCQ